MKTAADAGLGVKPPSDTDAERMGRGPGRLVRLGVTIAAATVAAQSAAHLVGVRLLDDQYLHLNADDEHGFPAWLSSSVTFTAAFASLLLALLREAVDRKLVALAGLLAFFSLDDAVGIHERLAEKVGDALGYGDTAERLIWPIVYLPLLIVGVALLLYVGRQLPQRLERLLRWGLGFLALAVVAEGVSTVLSAADAERGSWPDALEVIVEEGAELAAWILIATALLAAVLSLLSEDRALERRRPDA